MTTAAELLDAVPAVSGDSVAVALPETPASAASSDAAPPRKSRSGTSGAERRRRAKDEAGGQPITSSGTRNRATGDRAPRAGAKTSAPAKSEVDALVEALDKVLPFIALRDPYSAAVISKRRREIATALFQVPVLSSLVRALAKLKGGADNPYIVLLSVALPILAHHGKITGQAGAGVQVATSLLGLEPTAAEIAKAQATGLSALMNMGALSDVLAGVQTEADAARESAAA